MTSSSATEKTKTVAFIFIMYYFHYFYLKTSQIQQKLFAYEAFRSKWFFFFIKIGHATNALQLNVYRKFSIIGNNQSPKEDHLPSRQCELAHKSSNKIIFFWALKTLNWWSCPPYISLQSITCSCSLTSRKKNEQAIEPFKNLVLEVSTS